MRGTNGSLYHGFRQTSGLSSWRFENLGGQITGSPVAIVDGPRMLVAATTPGGSIYTIRGNNFAWGPWTKVVSQVNGNIPTQVKTHTPPSLVQNRYTGRITMYAAHVNYGLFAISKSVNVAFSGRWTRLDTLLPSDARIAAATNGPDSIVYARFLDRPSGQYVLAYTQFVDAIGEWSDYFLAPYACFNCAPYGVDTSAAGRAGTPRAARASSALRAPEDQEGPRRLIDPAASAGPASTGRRPSGRARSADCSRCDG